jgi:hypothetical protein
VGGFIGFDSIDAAFLDWQHACQSSPIASVSDFSLQVYKEFLQGNKKIDGLFRNGWQGRRAEENEKQKEILGKRPADTSEDDDRAPIAKKQLLSTETVIEAAAAVSTEEIVEHLEATITTVASYLQTTTLHCRSYV